MTDGKLTTPINPFYLQFSVTDKETREEADPAQIAYTEDWARDLEFSNMWGFAIGEDGSLFLADCMGNIRNCPDGRFEIHLDQEKPLAKVLERQEEG